MRSVKLSFILFLINHIFKGTRFFSIKRYLLRFAGVKIGCNSKIVGPIDFGSVIDITIGDNCWIGKNVFFDGNGTVVIGNNVDIAPHVVFCTGGHIVSNSFRRAGSGVSYHIKVCNGVWIGTRVTLLGDITLDKGIVVAAGSVVKNNFEADVLLAGIPAKIKKYLS